MDTCSYTLRDAKKLQFIENNFKSFLDIRQRSGYRRNFFYKEKIKRISIAIANVVCEK